MISVVLAAVFFVGIHLFVSGTRLRSVLVDQIGEKAFLVLFSVLSIIGIVWLCWAYARAPDIHLWATQVGFIHAALLLMIIALLFAAIGIATPNPAAVGGEALLNRDEPATGMLRVTRHPLMWGIAIWAFTHLVLNGDAASVVLFGSLLLLALVGPLLIDAKRRRALGEEWEHFAAVTSNVPFAAIVQGHNSLRLGEVGWWRIAVGLVLYAVVLHSHQWLFGVSPLKLAGAGG